GQPAAEGTQSSTTSPPEAGIENGVVPPDVAAATQEPTVADEPTGGEAPASGNAEGFVATEQPASEAAPASDAARMQEPSDGQLSAQTADVVAEPATTRQPTGPEPSTME